MFEKTKIFIIKLLTKKMDKIYLYDDEGVKTAYVSSIATSVYDNNQAQPVQPPKGYLQDAVIQPDKFKWFKCKSCGDKKYASKGDKMFYFEHKEYYSTFRTKWCMDCIMDVAYAMGATDKDFKKCEKRKMLRKLSGEDKDE